VAELAEEVVVPSGETIDSERDPRTGSSSSMKEGRGRAGRSTARRVGSGSFFGEIGLLVTGRRTASVVAVSPVRLIAVFDQSFRIMERELPTFAGSVRAACAERFPRV